MSVEDNLFRINYIQVSQKSKHTLVIRCKYFHLFFCGPVSMLFSQSDCSVCGPVFHDTDRSTGPLRIASYSKQKTILFAV